MLGFVVILVGTSLYNEIIRSCLPTSMASAGSRPDLEVSALVEWARGRVAAVSSEAMPRPDLEASAPGTGPYVASWQLCH